MRSRLLALGVCLWLGLAPRQATARPFTVDDLLKQESFGDVALDPTGRYAVVERRGPYDSAARFDLQHRNPLAASRLLLTDLQADPTARPLMPQPDGYGYLAGPWSPDGERLAVFRLGPTGWELGVVWRRSGEVDWLGLTPASDMRGRNVLWRSADALLVLVRPSDDPPWELRLGSQSARRLPPRWAASAAGQPAVTVIGSGAHLQAAPEPAPTALVDVELRRGIRRTLAAGRFFDMELSPDGRALALLEQGERLQPSAGRPPQGIWGTASEAVRLAVLDLADGGIARPCPRCDLLRTLLSWSPSGRRLLVFARAPDRPWTEGAFQLYAPATKRLTPLAGRGLAPALRYRPERVATGWLGEDVLVQAQAHPPTGARADWWILSPDGARNLTLGLPGEPAALMASPAGLWILADGRVWRVSAGGGAVQVGRDRLTPVAAPRRSPQHRLGQVAGRSPDAVLLRTHEGGLRLADGRPAPGLIGAGDQLLAFSPAAEAIFVLRTAPGGDAVLELRRRGRPPQVIAEINHRLRDTDLPRIVPVRHSGPGGKTLTSWLHLPPGPQGDRPPPLVIWPYLGESYPTLPAPKPGILSLVANPRVLTGQGYAVLQPSLPLPLGEREPLASLADRILAIVDAAAAQRPGAFDRARLALWGHSYGGYTTMAAIGQSDRFRAAIAMGAPSDLISHYGSFQISQRVSPEDGLMTSYQAGFAEDIQGRMGAPPWRAPGRYVRNSPIFHVEGICTPLLLVHGDQDPIALSQSEEMFSALYRLRRDALLVTYWGEGHVIASPGNVRDLYRRALGWLDRYLASDRATCSRVAGSKSGA
jgi:dipeptidyl aminopeptidase/acylaminoacyl peptidase